MNIDEVKAVVDTIVNKKKKKETLNALKRKVSDGASPLGLITITVRGRNKKNVSVEVDAVEFGKFIDKEIAKQGTTAEETDLKTKVK